MFSIIKKLGALMLLAIVGYLWDSHISKLTPWIDKVLTAI